MMCRDFVYWLQGALEVSDPKGLTSEQLDVVKRHLALVFVHEIDPSAGGPEVQAKLNEVHSLKERHAFTINDPRLDVMRC